MRNPLRIVSEQFMSSSLGSFFPFSGIRSAFRVIGRNPFWPKGHPRSEGTIVNYDLCRQMYRNSGEDGYGSAFAKPIIDLQVAFLGIPTVRLDDDNLEEHLNECLTDYWAADLQEMFKAAMRDSKVILRLRQPDILDPLMTLEEATHYQIECIAPERVEIQYSMRNKSVIEQVKIEHRMIIVVKEGDVETGLQAVEEEHDVVEVITRDSYRFFDKNTNTWMDDMRARNSWGFVPIMEVWNEWDSAIQGGQSDFESVIPFIKAFHDVVAQGLQAHRYHSTPKIKMKVEDVALFIKNNFASVWDETTGTVKDGASVDWSGREILFFNSQEDAEFLEAESVLGDTKTLADFLIDCIAIASQTPEWAFMRVDAGSANSDRNAQTVPFLRKIARKRINFQKAVQQLCKMALAAYGEIPYRAHVVWDQIRPDDRLVLAQAFQQMIMGLEVAAQRGEISDETYRETIREFLDRMHGDAYEERNAILPLPAPGNTPAGSSSSQPPAIEASKQGANA
jgi:hypothetical protein